jgi:hypothetical protein
VNWRYVSSRQLGRVKVIEDVLFKHIDAGGIPFVHGLLRTVMGCQERVPEQTIVIAMAPGLVDHPPKRGI